MCSMWLGCQFLLGLYPPLFRTVTFSMVVNLALHFWHSRRRHLPVSFGLDERTIEFSALHVGQFIIVVILLTKYYIWYIL
jgi:hypothetical protein